MNLLQHTQGNKGPCLRHPRLVVLDRDVDLVSALEHTSHYQADSAVLCEV